MILDFPDYHCDPFKIDFTIESIVELDILDYPKIDEEGTKRWYNKEDQFHRENGPAVIKYDRSEFYYNNGKLHRLDEPAVIFPNGRVEYWINGERHRVGGPAVIKVDGTELWYLNDVKQDAPESTMTVDSNGTKE